MGQPSMIFSLRRLLSAWVLCRRQRSLLLRDWYLFCQGIEVFSPSHQTRDQHTYQKTSAFSISMFFPYNFFLTYLSPVHFWSILVKFALLPKVPFAFWWGISVEGLAGYWLRFHRSTDHASRRAFFLLIKAGARLAVLELLELLENFGHF